MDGKSRGAAHEDKSAAVAALRSLLARVRADEDEEYRESEAVERECKEIRAGLDKAGASLEIVEEVKNLRREGNFAVAAEISLSLRVDNDELERWGGTLVGEWDLYASNVSLLMDGIDEPWPDEVLEWLDVNDWSYEGFPSTCWEVPELLGEEEDDDEPEE